MAKDKRVEVLFDPKDYRVLEEHAQSEGKSVGGVIRDAVTKYVTGPTEEERQRPGITSFRFLVRAVRVDHRKRSKNKSFAATTRMTRACMKLIDTNVIIYALGEPHPYLAPSSVVLRRTQTGEIAANINVQRLQELLHRYRSRGMLSFGFLVFDDVITQFSSPFPSTSLIAATARQILADHPRLQSRDAFHAATVFQHSLDGIISADSGFDEVSGLTRFDPMDVEEW